MYSINIIVKGNVQDVGYRYFCKMMADRLNILGWVKNIPDGTVEMLAAGEEDSVKVFVEYCKQGPSLARVESLTVKEAEFKKKIVSFEIK